MIAGGDKMAETLLERNKVQYTGVSKYAAVLSSHRWEVSENLFLATCPISIF